MLIGDNLNDFTKAFEKGSIAQRFTETDNEQAEWGRKFIVLPNATYGEWENAVYEYQRGLTPGQKEGKRVEKMKGY
jgi:predicted secreted acid phosphatase